MSAKKARPSTLGWGFAASTLVILALQALTWGAFGTSRTWFPLFRDDHRWALVPAGLTLGALILLQLGLSLRLLLAARRRQLTTRGRGRFVTFGALSSLDALVAAAMVGLLGWATQESLGRPFVLHGSLHELSLALPGDWRRVLEFVPWTRVGASVLVGAACLALWQLLPLRVRRVFWRISDFMMTAALAWLTARAPTSALPFAIAIAASMALTLGLTWPNDDPSSGRRRALLGLFAAFGTAAVMIVALFHPPLATGADLWWGVARLAVTVWICLRLVATIVPRTLTLLETVHFRLRVAARHLRAKKTGFLAIISVLSILAVTLSTAMLCVVLSVMGGFRKDLKDKILGSHAHVMIDMQHGTFPRWRPTLEAARVEGVVGATPYVNGEVMLRSVSARDGAVLRGIDTRTICDVTNLCSTLDRGRLEYLDHPEQLIDLPLEERGSLLPTMGDVASTRVVEITGDEASEGAPEGGGPLSDIDRMLREDLARIANETDEASGESTAPDATEAAAEAAAEDDAAEPSPEQIAAEGVIAALAEARARRAEQDDQGAASDNEGAASDDEGAASDDEGAASDNEGARDEGHEVRHDDAERPIARRDDARSARVSLRDLTRSSLSYTPPEPEILPGVLIGRELARSLRLFVGDEVDIVTPFGELGPTGPLPKTRRFRVAGVFYTGMYEYDAKMAYISIDTAQSFLATEDTISGIEIKLEERAVDDAPAVAAAVREAIDRTDVRVGDWQERNQNLFGALALEKLAMFLVLSLAILIAGFCVFSTLTLMVQEKQGEVGVLMTLGTTPRDVVSIFILEGLMIGTLGATLGLGLGWVLSFAAEHFGIPMNPENFYIDRLPVHTDATEFALVGAAAIAICTFATVFPAVLASRLRPLDALRHD